MLLTCFLFVITLRFCRPLGGESDLALDNEWTARMLSSTVCYDCGAPVDVDGDRCDACEGLRQLMFLSLLAI